MPTDDPLSRCSIDDCSGEVFVFSCGWCAKHYARWRRHGDPEMVIVEKSPAYPAGSTCSVEDCNNGGRLIRGLCAKHYARWQRHGDPLAIMNWQAENHWCWMGDEVGYAARHSRVRAVRGHARDHDCTACGRAARDWARVHGSDGLDVMDYMPLCRACHGAYDKPGALNPAAKLTDAIVITGRERYAAGETVVAIAGDLQVNKSTLGDALAGRSWRHLPIQAAA